MTSISERRRRLRLGVKGLLLFVLPLPLAASAAGALIGGDFRDLVLSAGLFLLFMLGAIATRQGLSREDAFARRSLARAGWIPLKGIGAGLVALASGLTAYLAVGHGLPMSLGYGGAALFGFFFAYGFDSFGLKAPAGLEPGVVTAEVAEAIDEAYGRLERIEDNNRQIRDREVNQRIVAIVDWGRKVLALIEQDPRDIRRARKFLNVYLDGAERVTERYARLEKEPLEPEIKHNFRTLLVDMENVFAEQHQKLLENDVLDLDVQVEVLTTRLRREGVL
jgi:hypothetical protein